MSPVLMVAAVVCCAGFAAAGVGQRAIARRAHRQALNVYGQAEALVILAAQYRRAGKDAYQDADELIRDARCRMQEWTT